MHLGFSTRFIGVRRPGLAAVLLCLAAITLLPACARGPAYVQPADRQTIDRKHIEYPSQTTLEPMVLGLTAPTALAIVRDEGPYNGSVLIAEGGTGGFRPRIFGFKPDGAFFEVYPRGTRVPFGIFKTGREIHGPVGGMVVAQNRIYVTHRDVAGRGVVSAFDFDGNRTTIVGDLPAQGDFSVTDIAVHPTTGRLYFGLGAATNSAVVGLDNYKGGWVKRYPKFCDVPATSLKLLGFRFDTKNPFAGLGGGSDTAVTAPFQPFGVSDQTRIPKSGNDKPTSAIYSVSPTGGDLRVEAHGIRLPRGLGFNEYANLYFTNNGMEMRGSRPVRDDPDVLLKLSNTWYGFPDFGADLLPISESRFQPPVELIQRSGYPELSFLIDHATSGLTSPAAYRDSLLFGVFPSLSGAGKLDFVPAGGPLGDFRGQAIIALSGDRAPFATSGETLKAPVGYKLMRVDLDTRVARDFVRNAGAGPGSRIDKRQPLLERPVDVKFGPDGTMYVLDFGRMDARDGRMRASQGTGKLFVLEPAPQSPTTAPALPN